MSVQVVALEGPPIPLPISDPDESEATALQVPDTDGDPLLPDGVMEDEGLVGPLHATDSAIDTASSQRRYEDIGSPLSLVAWEAVPLGRMLLASHTARVTLNSLQVTYLGRVLLRLEGSRSS